MKAVRLLALLVVGAVLWSQNASGQQAAVPKLTLAQVEDLVSHGVPDSTMGTQIQRRGLAFAPTPATVESLREKGAGPQTLAAIEALFPKPKPIVQKKVSITADVARSLLLQKPMVPYPPIARAARISGTVELRATISEGGSVEELQVVSGPPMLQQAALEAVRQWQYKPYLVNNRPVEVETAVNVIFTLGTDTPQSNTGTKPAASDSGPSLAATMQFIQDKINEQAQIAYVVNVGVQNKPGLTMRENVSFVADSVVADPATCILRAAYTLKMNMETYSDGKPVAAATFDQHIQTEETDGLKDVEKITVEKLEAYSNRRFVEKGHPELSATIAPSFFVVELSSSKLVFTNHESSTKGSLAPVVTERSEKQTVFTFGDEEIAGRVAKAFTHAVDLCGSGKKEPF